MTKFSGEMCPNGIINDNEPEEVIVEIFEPVPPETIWSARVIFDGDKKSGKNVTVGTESDCQSIGELLSLLASELHYIPDKEARQVISSYIIHLYTVEYL
ncbi:MAG: hypothetical protein WCG44_00245 [bacterium]